MYLHAANTKRNTFQSFVTCALLTRIMKDHLGKCNPQLVTNIPNQAVLFLFQRRKRKFLLCPAPTDYLRMRYSLWITNSLNCIHPNLANQNSAITVLYWYTTSRQNRLLGVSDSYVVKQRIVCGSFKRTKRFLIQLCGSTWPCWSMTGKLRESRGAVNISIAKLVDFFARWTEFLVRLILCLIISSKEETKLSNENLSGKCKISFVDQSLLVYLKLLLRKRFLS